MEILRCIRYQYLPQDILLKLSTDSAFFLGKELIVQGLALKLGGHEPRSDEIKINTKPRDINNHFAEAGMVDENGQQIEEGSQQ